MGVGTEPRHKRAMEDPEGICDGGPPMKAGSHGSMAEREAWMRERQFRASIGCQREAQLLAHRALFRRGQRGLNRRYQPTYGRLAGVGDVRLFGTCGRGAGHYTPVPEVICLATSILSG